MDKEIKGVRGYKVFRPDWTCRGFQYKVGETFEEDVVPECCKRGFHFCTKASDCFNYYNFRSENKVAEVLALGMVDTESGDTKCCTNKIQIVREISWQELLTIVNTGINCTGMKNAGDHNSGDYNSGDHNSGNCNVGDSNAGNYNIGDRNTGFNNIGDRNIGSYNIGNYNTGDFNFSSFNNGCFMTATAKQKIMMFNKLTDWTYDDWIESDAYNVLVNIPRAVRWVSLYNMTDKEKERHPEYKTTGGYLKDLDSSELQNWWDNLTDNDKKAIKSLPNFDAEIFRKCTGIRVK
mgnify:FL=1